MSEEKEITAWKSILIGAVLGVPAAMCGAIFPLSFHFADSQAAMLFCVFPIGGFIGGVIVGVTAHKLAKKHPKHSWKKRLKKGLLIIFLIFFLISIPMVI